MEHRVQTVPRLGKSLYLQKDFYAVSDDPDMEYVMVDATIVRVHRHGQGTKAGPLARLLANPEAE